jgi:hypothetical protein
MLSGCGDNQIRLRKRMAAFAAFFNEQKLGFFASATTVAVVLIVQQPQRSDQ